MCQTRRINQRFCYLSNLFQVERYKSRKGDRKSHQELVTTQPIWLSDVSVNIIVSDVSAKDETLLRYVVKRYRIVSDKVLVSNEMKKPESVNICNRKTLSLKKIKRNPGLKKLKVKKTSTWKWQKHGRQRHVLRRMGQRMSVNRKHLVSLEIRRVNTKSRSTTGGDKREWIKQWLGRKRIRLHALCDYV